MLMFVQLNKVNGTVNKIEIKLWKQFLKSNSSKTWIKKKSEYFI